jgi:hypothetical protein
MYKVCPKCKQPLNASTEAPKSEEQPQQEENTKLLTGIFWSYPKAMKDPEKFKEYAKKNPNDSTRLINKWKEQGNDVSILAEAHPMNIIQEGVSTHHSNHTEKPSSTAAPSSSSSEPVSTVKTKADVNVLSVGKDHKKHYVSWTIAPGQFARNISAQEFIEMSDADGVYVQEGVTAVLFIDGVEAAEMEGGVYSFATEKTHDDARKDKAEEEAAIRAKEGLVQKLGRLGRSVAHFFYHSHDAIREERRKDKESTQEHIRRITSKSVVSVVLKRDGVIQFTMGIRPVTSEDGTNNLEFAPYKIRTQTLTLDVSVAMEARIHDFREFRTTYLMDRNSYSVNDLCLALNAFMRTSLQRSMQNYAADGDSLPQDLMASISYNLMTQSRELLHGIAISNVINITTANEYFDRFHAIDEKLFITEKEIDYLSRTNEFKNRLQSVENQQKVIEAKTELDLRKELDKINNDQLVHEDEMEAFVELERSKQRIRLAQTENEELAELLKLKGNRLISEDELDALETSIRDKKFDRDQVSAEFQLRAANRTEMSRVQLDLQLHKSQLLAEAELNDIRFDELRKDQARQFQLEDAEQEHDLAAARRQDEYIDSRREKDAEFTDTRREKDFDFEQRQKDAEYERTHREVRDNLEIERQKQTIDETAKDAEHRRKMEHLQELIAARDRAMEKMHDEEMARIAAQQNMSAEQLMATGMSGMDAAAQKAFAESFAAGKGGEKEREMYERMLKMQAESSSSNQEQQAAMMKQMMEMMQGAMQTNATMATNMAAGQAAQQQANLDAIQNVAGARHAQTEAMKDEYRQQMEHEQKRTDAAQDKALNYTTKVTQEEIKAAAKTGKVEKEHQEKAPYYLPDFGADYTLKEIGNLILNGTIDPETELEVNGESLTVAEVDELLPFLEKKYGGA